MNKIDQQQLTGERALYGAQDTQISRTIFSDGESPLKEARNIAIDHTIFKWKYPLWYDQNVSVTDSTFETDAHAGIWYTNHLTMTNVLLNTSKTFRRCRDLTLQNVDMPDAKETLWNCQDIQLDNVSVTGNYFGMNSNNIVAHHLRVTGNYAFDGAENVEIHDSTLLTKDCFWNCNHVTVYNSTIIGEYLAWNTNDITFINCTIESEQGLCYIDHLTLRDCQLLNTDLAFERCAHIDATVTTTIDSIKNPVSGRIEAPKIGSIILDSKQIDPTQTQIIQTGSED